MSCKLLTFSPTGGTHRVAQLLSAALDTAPNQIDLCSCADDFSQIQLSAGDVCIVAVPSFAGRVPDIAASRLRQIPGNGAKAVLVAVYGNRAFEDTLVELKDTLQAQGFRCIAGVSAIAEHSIMRQFASGRPDVQDEAMLTEFSRQIADKLSAGNLSAPALPGNRPYRAYTPSPLHPQADQSVCTACGACAKSCPVGAIPLDAPHATNDCCISCMRCVRICPQHARQVNADMLNALTQRLSAACTDRKENELFL